MIIANRLKALKQLKKETVVSANQCMCNNCNCNCKSTLNNNLTTLTNIYRKKCHN